MGRADSGVVFVIVALSLILSPHPYIYRTRLEYHSIFFFFPAVATSGPACAREDGRAPSVISTSNLRESKTRKITLVARSSSATKRLFYTRQHGSCLPPPDTRMSLLLVVVVKEMVEATTLT